jgi:hypothetical protein
VALFRVLRTAKATLSRSFYLDEVESTATGSVMVSVTRLDGTSVDAREAVANGSAYDYEFPGSDVLDDLVVTWSLTIGGDAMVLGGDRIEVVGGFFFGLAEGRDVDRALSDPIKFPTAKLIEKRTEVETECERITGQAWVPRFYRETLSSFGTGRALQLRWPFVRAIRAVTVSGVAYGAPGLAGLRVSPLGLLIRDAGWVEGHSHIVVEYEHGHDVLNPEIVRAAKIRFKSLMLEASTALPDSAERRITVDSAGGSTVYSAPTAEKTGLPAVDAIYGRYGDARPGFG